MTQRSRVFILVTTAAWEQTNEVVEYLWCFSDVSSPNGHQLLKCPWTQRVKRLFSGFVFFFTACYFLWKKKMLILVREFNNFSTTFILIVLSPRPTPQFSYTFHPSPTYFLCFTIPDLLTCIHFTSHRYPFAQQCFPTLTVVFLTTDMFLVSVILWHYFQWMASLRITPSFPPLSSLVKRIIFWVVSNHWWFCSSVKIPR